LELLVLSLRNLPFVKQAAGAVGTYAVKAGASVAAAKSETASTVIGGIGTGAKAVSSVAGSSLTVIDIGVQKAAKPVGFLLATGVGTPVSVIMGAAYALGALSGPVALLITAASIVVPFVLGRFLTRTAADMAIGNNASTVKAVADGVADVCDAAAPVKVPAVAPGAEKERPVA
jgi:hypothetical protein